MRFKNLSAPLGALLALVLMVLAIWPASATTFYVRPDGGTPEQCTGQADAAYPGTGVSQACAWSHPYQALPPGSSPRIAGGDTLLIKYGSYPMGYGAPETSTCNTNARRDCYNSAPPPGPDADHPTRILGEGWDSGCLQPPELWGQERANSVLHLVGSSHTEVRCLEITDHSSCAYDYVQIIPRCNKTTTPHGPYAVSGIYVSDATGLILRDLNIHGLASGGVVSGRLSNLLVERVRIASNAWVGWSGDLGSGSSNNTGTMTFRELLIEWNGCLETWPEQSVYGCWAQSLGGYGDGVGFAATDGDFLFEDSTFRYNTSDGLDVLYHSNNGTVHVVRSWSEGNAGNQFKFHGTGSIVNSVAIGNCNFFAGKPYDIGVDHCRALGDVISAYPATGGSLAVVNNTVIGNGNVAMNLNADNTATLTVRNNIVIGFKSHPSPDRNMAGLYIEGTPTLVRDHNIWFNIHNAICPDGAGSSCVDPQLVSSSMTNPMIRLKPTSPAINGGNATGAPAADFYNVPRPARGGVDIGAVEQP